MLYIGTGNRCFRTDISGIPSSPFRREKTTEKSSVEKQTFVEGNSKPFSIEPVNGVKISAEENAFDKDREIKFEEASETQYNQCSSVLTSEINEFSTLQYLWELDAGLADDELLPGNFKMSFDLQELGIPPEQYQHTSVYRIDDNGIWYEYASGLEGSVLSVESNQNSLIGIVTAVVIFSPITIDTVLIEKSGGFFFDSDKCRYDVEIDGKKRFQLFWKPEEILESLQGVCKRITSDIVKVSEQRTRQELSQRYGEENVNKWYKDGKFVPDDKNRQREYDRIRNDYINSIKSTNEEFKEMEKQIQEVNAGTRKLIDDKDLFYVAQAIKSCELAYPFLTKRNSNKYA